MTSEAQYNLLIASVLLLAAPAQEQISALPEVVCATDEIASTFGDAFLFVGQLERVGLVSEHAARALRELDEFFENMPDDPVLADRNGLKNHPFWAEVRRLAEVVLRSLNEERRSPQMSGTEWVKG